MRILILGDANSVHVSRWRRALAQLGAEVHVATPTPTETDEPFVYPATPGRLGSSTHPRHWFRYLQMVFHARRLLKRVQPDVIHIQGAWPYTIPYVLMAGPTPIILTLWGSDVYVSARANARRRWILRSICRRADLVIAASEDLLDQAEDICGKLRYRKVLFWGFDDEPYLKEQSAELPSDIPVAREAKVLVSPRSAKPLYRIDLIITAFSSVASLHPDVHLVLLQGTGSLEYMNELKVHAERLGVSNRITFVHRRLSSEEMIWLFRRAVGIVSIPQSDALAATILEAMAAGAVPIVWELPSYEPLKTIGGVVRFVSDPNSLIAEMDAVVSDKFAEAKHLNPEAARRLGTLTQSAGIVFRVSKELCKVRDK